MHTLYFTSLLSNYTIATITICEASVLVNTLYRLKIFVTGGEEPNAFSGEEYRQVFRNGMIERQQEILALPWAAGSGLESDQGNGFFFCARIGDRVFLRFVPSDGEADLIRDTLGSLRMVTCERVTPRHMPDGILEGANRAWGQARSDIFKEWSYATNPANLQPRVRPLFRDIAEHLRKNPPTGTSNAELNKLIDSIEAPWGMRIECQLREIFKRGDRSGVELSNALVEKIRDLGLEPFAAPKPLPVIDEDEVQLVCWMAVS